MKLLGTTRLGRRAATDPQTAPPENDSATRVTAVQPTSKLEAQRIKSARANKAWTELDPSMLVRRGRRFLVHAQDDRVFVPFQGAAFNALGGVEFAAMNPLYYTVNGHIRLLELYPRSWSDIVRAQAGAR